MFDFRLIPLDRITYIYVMLNFMFSYHAKTLSNIQQLTFLEKYEKKLLHHAVECHD